LTRHQQKCNDAAADKQSRAAWCHRQYVNAKDCDKWVANECEWNLEEEDKKRDREDAKRDQQRDREDKLRDANRDQKEVATPAAAANDADTASAKTSKEDPSATPQVLSLAAGGNLLENLPITCLVSLSAIVSLGMFVRRRHLGQEAALRQEAALLNDPSPV